MRTEQLESGVGGGGRSLQLRGGCDGHGTSHTSASGRRGWDPVTLWTPTVGGIFPRFLFNSELLATVLLFPVRKGYLATGLDGDFCFASTKTVLFQKEKQTMPLLSSVES